MKKQVELNQDEIELITVLCNTQIKKAQKMKQRVESSEFLNASGGKAKSMLNIGLVEHLYSQTAEQLLRKIGVYITTNKDQCPACGSSLFSFDKSEGAYLCQDCRRFFDYDDYDGRFEEVGETE